MRKKFVTTAFVIMVILFIVGLILIFSSGSIGNLLADKELQKNGGVWIGDGLNQIRTVATTNCQIVGAILSVLGGIGFYVTGYGIYKELEN